MLAPYKFPDLTPLDDVKPRTFTPDLDGLIAFCASQPADRQYPYWNCHGKCLLGQFATAVTGRFNYVRMFGGQSGASLFEDLAAQEPHTFGGALSRALSLRSESPVGGKVGL